ncbi:hypothetical protein IWQ60_009039 [Tieghemiomyces parasiticus]|uniref:Uncharacterized protein n=1 Tax=Tieghemiomyces parasiticus TaxID=78921 RepID=A0A9W7ZPL6_9FUNG|nr:hypothetical protein IWQ60_009039 [Tieghemiomyces parasiticus]
MKFTITLAAIVATQSLVALAAPSLPVADGVFTYAPVSNYHHRRALFALETAEGQKEIAQNAADALAAIKAAGITA